MAYVLLPNSGQSLGVTRAQIRENFNLIQQTFDRNHYDFDAANQGKHSVIQTPEQITFPATPANEGQLLAREYNSKTELAWRPENTLAGGDQYMLSGMPIRAAARFDGSGANGNKAPIGLSFNVDTISKAGLVYTITFLSQFPIGAPAANYLVIPYAAILGSTEATVIVSAVAAGSFVLTMQTTGGGTPPDFVSFIVLGG